MLYFLRFDLLSNVSAIDDYNFAIVGDSRCTSDTKNSKFPTRYKTLNLLCTSAIYPLSSDSWLEMIYPIDEKIKITIGNQMF
jgi:hypothetical protein